MKKLLIIVVFTFSSQYLFSQTQSTCTVVYDEITITQTCRYCKVHKSYKDIQNAHFKDNKEQIRYKTIIHKLTGNLILNAGLSDLLLGDKSSKICDMSMTSKHGFEKTYSKTQKQKNIQRSTCENYLSKSNTKNHQINSHQTTNKNSTESNKESTKKTETFEERMLRFNFGD